MLKLYFIIAFIYSAFKTIDSDEKTPVGIIGFFLTKFFLFPISAIKDIVKSLGGSNEQ